VPVIPFWTGEGVLPPNNREAPTSSERSPYKIDVSSFVLRFATSQGRKDILKGFLTFRERLYETGIIKGFQWINGSFVENIETIAKRPPNDVDVVTFFYLDEGIALTDDSGGHPDFFFPQKAKKEFMVDAYFVQLNSGYPELLVERASYWYSLWSHNRSGQWKGFLEIPLSPKEDRTFKASFPSLLERKEE
jgi:hypothetical protein